MDLSHNERRFAWEKRRLVAEMSREEMQRHLLTSEATGLPNRRAFEEAEQSPFVAMSDLDGLKAVNDTYGYEAGDMLLKAKATALREAGLNAYHDKGDEFLFRSNSVTDLQDGLERARARLRFCQIAVKDDSGKTLHFAGADFSYGLGTSLRDAELSLKRRKAERHAAGELARGVLCGIRLL